MKDSMDRMMMPSIVWRSGGGAYLGLFTDGFWWMDLNGNRTVKSLSCNTIDDADDLMNERCISVWYHAALKVEDGL